MNRHYPEPPDGASPKACLLVHPRDIRLSDVIAEHYRHKRDPEYRRKNLPESALTDAERIAIAETARRERHAEERERRREREAIDRERSEWWERHPLGCEVDGYAYDPRWKKGTLYCAPGHKPIQARVIALFKRGWPDVRRILTFSGNEPLCNYVKRGPEWEALRPGHADYVY